MFLLSSMLLFTGGMARATSGKVGLCMGRISETGISKTGKGLISAAAVIPRSELQRYKGAVIRQVRVALVTAEGVNDLTAWVRNSMDGDNLCAAGVSSLHAGWNVADVDGGIIISGNEDLVVGYSFYQESSVSCISVAGVDDADGYWVAKDDKWQNRSSDYDGSLSVELVVDGDNVPSKNLTLVSVSTERKVVKKGEQLHVSCKVRCTGTGEVVEGVSYSYTVSGMCSGIQTSGSRLEYGDEETVVFDVPTGDIATDVPLELCLAATTPGDGFSGDDTATIPFSVYTESLERKVLIEEFTSEHCANCPRAIETIETCMDEGYGSDFVQISHHVGFRDDWLTVEEDKYYEWFYGDKGSYAPAGMLDRTQSGTFGSAVPVFGIGYPEQLRPMLDEAMSVPAFASIAQTVNYDGASRTATVAVEMSKLPPLDVLCPSPRLTLIVLEDSILARDQAGYNSTSFRHRHVFRKCLTNIWGDTISWNDRMAAASYSFTLPEDWDARYVETVAFVSGYDPADRNNCKVMNTSRAELVSLPASVSEVDADCRIRSTDYYDLSGRLLSVPVRGVCVKAVRYGDGTVSKSKVIF